MGYSLPGLDLFVTPFLWADFDVTFRPDSSDLYSDLVMIFLLLQNKTLTVVGVCQRIFHRMPYHALHHDYHHDRHDDCYHYRHDRHHDLFAMTKTVFVLI